MRIRKNDQHGFSVVELLIVLVVLAALAFVAYGVHNRLATKTAATTPVTTSSTTQAATATDVPAAPTVSSTSDLDSALKVLNQNDPSAMNTSDSTQLNSQASTF